VCISVCVCMVEELSESRSVAVGCIKSVSDRLGRYRDTFWPHTSAQVGTSASYSTCTLYSLKSRSGYH
jgi:hypothetical protein